MADVIKVRCPRCKSLLRIPDQWLTQSIQCKCCKKSFRAQRKSELAKVEKPRSAGPIAQQPIVQPDDDLEFGTARSANPEFEFDAAPDLGFLPAVAPGATFRSANSSPRRFRLVMVGALSIALAGLAVVNFYFPDLFGGSAPPASSSAPELVKKPENSGAKTTDLPTGDRNFPRRMLFIGVHQYLYANPTSPTPSERSLVPAVREFAESKLRMNKEQVYVLSDVGQDKDARPPLKPIIEQTIERFLGTCRPQDRIIVVFVGHAVEIDEQPYLVPIEGELTVKETLIPLKWLYDRLATCPARQKVLIADVCRFESSRGFERPGSGPMGAKLDAALANPPTGVQVWSACTAGQQSHEYELAQYRNYVARGGAFLSLMLQAFTQGGNIQKPGDDLPLEFLTKHVNGPVQEIVKQRESGAVQTPRLSGAERGEGMAFDVAQPMPLRFELPKPAMLADGGIYAARDIQAIFSEIAIPPQKLPREALKEQPPPEIQAAALAGIFPFSAARMKDYAPDAHSLREVLAKPKEFPLRVAVLRTVEALDRQGRLNKIKVGDKEVNSEGLIDKVRDLGADETVKKSLTKSQQDGPALMLVELQEMLEVMEKAGKDRDKEPSKRWQAHYDYVMARLKMRMVYVNEYNLVIAKVKRDELPKLDTALHNGWRLASQEKIASPKEVKDLASDAKKLLAKLIQEHAGTPWEVLAKRERSTALGLSWQPTKLGAE